MGLGGAAVTMPVRLAARAGSVAAAKQAWGLDADDWLCPMNEKMHCVSLYFRFGQALARTAVAPLTTTKELDTLPLAASISCAVFARIQKMLAWF